MNAVENAMFDELSLEKIEETRERLGDRVDRTPAIQWQGSELKSKILKLSFHRLLSEWCTHIYIYIYDDPKFNRWPVVKLHILMKKRRLRQRSNTKNAFFQQKKAPAATFQHQKRIFSRKKGACGNVPGPKTCFFT